MRRNHVSGVNLCVWSRTNPSSAHSHFTALLLSFSVQQQQGKTAQAKSRLFFYATHYLYNNAVILCETFCNQRWYSSRAQSGWAVLQTGFTHFELCSSALRACWTSEPSLWSIWYKTNKSLVNKSLFLFINGVLNQNQLPQFWFDLEMHHTAEWINTYHHYFSFQASDEAVVREN